MATPLSCNIAQPGLRWQEGVMGARPVWTKTPSIEIIKKLSIKHLELSDEDDCTVDFFAEGGFNKLYAITCAKGSFVFRVTLPIAPIVKTKSEVATLKFVRHKTTIPVPYVIAFNADLTNELGFEWILMERLDGRPLRERWHDLSWLQKGLMVQQIADYVAQLSRLRMPCTGSIFLPSPTQFQTYQIGEAVLSPFFMEDHIHLAIPRGPFSSSHSLVTAYMQHLHHDIATHLDSTDSDEQADAEEMHEIFTKLAPLISGLFPPSTDATTFLFHPDLSANNILINDHGTLTGIVDWECVMTAPPWLACQLPEFLEGPSRSVLDCPDANTSVDPEVVADHEEQMLDYEKAQMRRFFLEEMERIEPAWVQVFSRESTRRDFVVAIDLLALGMRMGLVRGWVKAVGEGREPKISLTDALRKD